MGAGLADESVCPTLTHKDLLLSGVGAFACEPFFKQILALTGRGSATFSKHEHSLSYFAN
jgi:hypothetical protein